jgi:putative ABC transport system permease protein
MYLIALKMLIEDKAKYIGMVLSLSLSTIIIIQQMAIFLGIMKRSYAAITDVPQAQVWVMNPSVKNIEDINPLRDIDLYRVKSIRGVKWAMPYYSNRIRVKLPNGQFETSSMIGIDAATLIGGPHTMVEGKVEYLRKPFSIIIDENEAKRKLAQYQGPGRPRKPLRVGDQIEINDRRATVVGIARVTRRFRADPVIYTTYKRALIYSPTERKQLSFIIAQSQDGVSPQELCDRIEKYTEFKAFTKDGFETLTVNYYLRYTGIPINFGIAVILGLLVGAAISGQIFFNFTSDNLKYFALFNVVGASRYLLAKMLLIQAFWVALIGWGLGAGTASFIGFITRGTELSFFLPWQLLVGSCVLVLIICVVSSFISIRRIFGIELSQMFK